MESPKLQVICALAVAVGFGSLRVAASDKPVAIDTNPPGAQVVVNGNAVCTTPCSIQVPSNYFGAKHTALSSHGTQPIRVTLTKAGYAPKTVDLTTGPHRWTSLNGQHSFDYYLIESDHFSFQLDPISAPPVEQPPPVVVPPPEPKPAAPASLPAIVVASPAGVGQNQTVECTVSPLVIRGVATDTSGILLITVNGSTANMRPQNAQATEFWTEPMPIAAGITPVEITASNSAHIQSTLAFTLHYAPKAAAANPKALSKRDIIALLKGAVPSSRVADLVKDRGIKFTPTDDDLNDIRDAGGKDGLIQAIQQAAASP